MQTVRVDQLANVLAEAVRDGVRLERERIIKLLEGKKASEIIYTTHPIEADCDVIYRLILLIKGEK